MQNLKKLFECRSCGKKLKPKNGILSCCGFMEKLQESLKENIRHRNDVRTSVAMAFSQNFRDESTSWINDEGEIEHEGMPNE